MLGAWITEDYGIRVSDIPGTIALRRSMMPNRRQSPPGAFHLKETLMPYGPKMQRILLATFALLLSFASTSHAALFRAYLALGGSDANPCTVVAPCRLLPAALAAVADGGEIWMLDSANYNTTTVNVTKSVTILAIPGAVGSVVTNGAVAINIATPGVAVTLRNLAFVKLTGTASADGVEVTEVSEVTIEGCTFSNMAIGVQVVAAAMVRISDTSIRHGGIGVAISAGATAQITNTRIFAMASSGVLAAGNVALATTTLSISDSVLSQNERGAWAFSTLTNAPTRIILTRATVSENSLGLISQTSGLDQQGQGLIAFSYSLITGNTTFGLLQVGIGVLKSLGNNHVSENAVNLSGTITPLAPM
jgi:hypothetical protein